MTDPNARLPEVNPSDVAAGVNYSRLYLQHVLWNRYQLEGMPEQAGMRYAIQLLEKLEEQMDSK